jgi:4-aminobutyrate aminotransferase-like enzyme
VVKQGTDENGILISPPFIISKQEADELLEKFTKSLIECK